MQTNRRVRQILMISVAIIALAACGSSKSSSSSSASGNTSGGSSKAKDCSSVPAATVNQYLGTNYGEPDANKNGSIVVCQYSAEAGTTAIIRFVSDSNADDFSTGKQGFSSAGQSTTDVSGLGDEAYSSAMGGTGLVPATNTLVARKGSTEILITSQAAADKERSLMTHLLG
jgi:ABC-type Fe3+-hydroxamate transport system substrate-binding protein